MPDREKIITAIEKAKKQSKEYAQDRIIVPFEEADMIITLLKEQDNCENCAIAIEDRQPVVRCRDCKHWEPEHDGHCPYNHIFTVPDWFCADGERKSKDD